jgi:hypothetical protein
MSAMKTTSKSAERRQRTPEYRPLVSYGTDPPSGDHYTPIMPITGDTKPCIFNRCTGTMEWTRVHLQHAGYEDDREFADLATDFEAWVCEECGIQQRGSAIGTYESKQLSL